MDRPDQIQLVLTEHRIDASRASCLLCPPGTVLVEMLPAPHSLNGLLLPDQVAADCRPDVGIVLAAGPDVTLEPGATVAVSPYDGQWIEQFSVPGYETSHQVRIYGKATPFEGEIHRTPWSGSIPLTIDPLDESMTATQNNLIVRREPVVQTEGMVALPQGAHYRTGLATVLSIGPKAQLALRGERPDGGDSVRIGDRIHYDTRGELEFAFGGDPDLAVIPDLAVNFTLRP